MKEGTQPNKMKRAKLLDKKPEPCNWPFRSKEDFLYPQRSELVDARVNFWFNLTASSHAESGSSRALSLAKFGVPHVPYTFALV